MRYCDGHKYTVDSMFYCVKCGFYYYTPQSGDVEKTYTPTTEDVFNGYISSREDDGADPWESAEEFNRWFNKVTEFYKGYSRAYPDPPFTVDERKFIREWATERKADVRPVV